MISSGGAVAASIAARTGASVSGRFVAGTIAVKRGGRSIRTILVAGTVSG